MFLFYDSQYNDCYTTAFYEDYTYDNLSIPSLSVTSTIYIKYYVYTEWESQVISISLENASTNGGLSSWCNLYLYGVNTTDYTDSTGLYHRIFFMISNLNSSYTAIVKVTAILLRTRKRNDFETPTIAQS